jgi:hypothetical protein
MGTDEIDEIGPVDYLLAEWPGRQPQGEVAPRLIDLVERGLIRLLDFAVIAKAVGRLGRSTRDLRRRRRGRGVRGLRRRLFRPPLR